MSAIKDWHFGEGHPWNENLARAARLFNLSMARGIGPPRQSEPLNIEAICALDLGEEPLVKGGPVGVNDLAILFTYFLVP